MATRSYQMSARAEAVEQTRRAVMQATIARYLQAGMDGLTLDQVAQQAGVTVQTILRHFGSKEGLVSSTVDFARADILRARRVEPSDDVHTAVEKLLAAYEAFGELNWQLLRDETRDPTIHGLLEEARATHRDWLEKVFSAHLPRRGSLYQQRLALLIAATDYYLWKLYRRDLGYSAARTRQLLHAGIEALCASFAASETA